MLANTSLPSFAYHIINLILQQVSCVDLEVVNKSSLLALVKKKNQVQDIAKGFPKDNENVVNEEVEVESEEVAFNVKCKKGKVPSYNPKTEAVVIRHIHYYYISRIMYCCKKWVKHANMSSKYNMLETQSQPILFRPRIFEYVVPECKVVFDDLCSPKVVRRADENMDCSELIFA